MRIEPGARFVWEGPAGDSDTLVAMFEATGDDVTIAAGSERGSEAIVECAVPMPFVYAVKMHGRRGLTVTGISTRNCQHVQVGAAAMDYQSVITSGPAANIARDVTVTGGGARFDTMPGNGHGSCRLTYVQHARVSGAAYENVTNGIQWWGGDAGLEPWQNGARANERKCTDLVIDNCTVKGAHVGGIWGSMGRNVVVRNCVVEDCLDVGFDAEGSDATRFERCHSRNGHNGCFATFFLNHGVRFVDCTGIVDSKDYPLFRVHNVSQSSEGNRDVALEGGRFECLDPAGPATMDCARGPVAELSITGASLRNVRIDTFFLNMHRTLIANNTLLFDESMGPVAAIRAGASHGLDGEPGAAIVADNRIAYLPPSAAGERARAGPVAIEIIESDYNFNARSTVSGNVISGPFAAGIVLANASSNPGIAPVFEVSGNRFEKLAPAAASLRVEQRGARARAPELRWNDGQTLDGRRLGLAEALGNRS